MQALNAALGSVFTVLVVVGYVLYGRGSRAAPVVVLGAQAAWAAMIVIDGAWSMVPGWVAITAVQAWNLRTQKGGA